MRIQQIAFSLGDFPGELLHALCMALIAEYSCGRLFPNFFAILNSLLALRGNTEEKPRRCSALGSLPKIQ